MPHPQTPQAGAPPAHPGPPPTPARCPAPRSACPGTVPPTPSPASGPASSSPADHRSRAASRSSHCCGPPPAPAARPARAAPRSPAPAPRSPRPEPRTTRTPARAAARTPHHGHSRRGQDLLDTPNDQQEQLSPTRPAHSPTPSRSPDPPRECLPFQVPATDRSTKTIFPKVGDHGVPRRWAEPPQAVYGHLSS